ncbi:MAG TPA: RNA-binding S4 domain-containing protein [Pseudonocardiaceae bacterium]
MQVPEVTISDDMIRLGQFLKLAGLADDGGEAKAMIEDGEVSVNGRVDTRRGRQLHDGDVITCAGRSVRLIAASA